MSLQSFQNAVLNNIIKGQKLYLQDLARPGSWRPIRMSHPSAATAAVVVVTDSSRSR